MLDKTLGYDPNWMAAKHDSLEPEDVQAACWGEVEKEIDIICKEVGILPGLYITEAILLASYRVLQRDPPIFTAEFLAKVVVQGI